MTRKAKTGKQPPAKAVAPLGDPATGEVIVTLADGVARRLSLNVRALLVLEQMTGKPFYDAITGANVLELLYAGVVGDAQRRGETWTPEIAAELVSVELMIDVTTRVRWAQMVAIEKLGQGAKKAAGELAANAGNGTGPRK